MNRIRNINGFYCEINEDGNLVNSEFLLNEIANLTSQSFEGWSQDQKNSYLTAMISIKQILNKTHQ